MKPAIQSDVLEYDLSKRNSPNLPSNPRPGLTFFQQALKRNAGSHFADFNFKYIIECFVYVCLGQM